MGNIMNMTIGQILQAIPHHPLKAILLILAADNVLISICASMGWTKEQTFLLKVSKFIYAVLAELGKKIPSISPKTVTIFLMGVACLFSSGCASGNMKILCGQINSTGNTVPYTMGTLAGNGFICYQSYIGFGKPDYTALNTISTAYIAAQNNKISTVVPMTVTLTPVTK